MLTLHELTRLDDLPAGYYAIREKRHWTVALWCPAFGSWLVSSARKKGKFWRDADFPDEIAERVA